MSSSIFSTHQLVEIVESGPMNWNWYAFCLFSINMYVLQSLKTLYRNPFGIHLTI